MPKKEKYTVGKRLKEWNADTSQSLTFIVTEECNLRCKYCYVTHKQAGKVMPLEVAQKFIDLMLSQEIKSPSVVLEFIGGEPLLEVELIDKICDYFKRKAFELRHPWYWNYRISIGTNGVNYSDTAVQKFIEKNKWKVSVGITLDGTKKKHDLQRVFPNGDGSYDVIMKNIPLWLSQFPGTTKVTFSSDDLPLLKESIISLWNLGITEVAANVVFEDVWKEGDDKIFEDQLKQLADYIIENDLYNKYQCTFFEEKLGNPVTEKELCSTSCGAGKMLALNYEGNIYPCIRYYDHSLNHREGYIIGNIEEGLFWDKLRAFGLAMRKHQCDEECRECAVGMGCSFCQGFSYDEADTPTSFQRAKYICKMHRARVRANLYYFSKLKNIKDIEREALLGMKNKMIFVLGDDYVSFCSYKNKQVSQKKMTEENIVQGLKFAEQNFYSPVFLHSLTEEKFEQLDIYNNYDILHIAPVQNHMSAEVKGRVLLVFTLENIESEVSDQDNVILLVEQGRIAQIGNAVNILLEKYRRVNLKIVEQDRHFPYELYKKQLENVRENILKSYKKDSILREVNVITDILFSNSHEICGAGDTLVSYAPDGKFYVCPAYYTDGKEDVGNPQEGISIRNMHLYSLKYAPLCSNCDAYQCENCIFINQSATAEVNISPEFQCVKAHIEREVSEELERQLKDEVNVPHPLKKITYVDPYTVAEADGKNYGVYAELKRK